MQPTTTNKPDLVLLVHGTYAAMELMLQGEKIEERVGGRLVATRTNICGNECPQT
jgi:hypothetical protein